MPWSLIKTALPPRRSGEICVLPETKARQSRLGGTSVYCARATSSRKNDDRELVERKRAAHAGPRCQTFFSSTPARLPTEPVSRSLCIIHRLRVCSDLWWRCLGIYARECACPNQPLPSRAQSIFPFTVRFWSRDSCIHPRHSWILTANANANSNLSQLVLTTPTLRAARCATYLPRRRELLPFPHACNARWRPRMR